MTSFPLTLAPAPVRPIGVRPTGGGGRVGGAVSHIGGVAQPMICLDSPAKGNRVSGVRPACAMGARLDVVRGAVACFFGGETRDRA